MTQTLEEQVEDFEYLGVWITTGGDTDDTEVEPLLDFIPKVDHEQKGVIEFKEYFKQALRTAEKRGARNLAIQIQAYHEAYVGDEMEKKNFVVGTMGLVKEALTNITK